jgi:hypothetical protein
MPVSRSWGIPEACENTSRLFSCRNCLNALCSLNHIAWKYSWSVNHNHSQKLILLYQNGWNAAILCEKITHFSQMIMRIDNRQLFDFGEISPCRSLGEMPQEWKNAHMRMAIFRHPIYRLINNPKCLCYAESSYRRCLSMFRQEIAIGKWDKCARMFQMGSRDSYEKIARFFTPGFCFRYSAISFGETAAASIYTPWYRSLRSSRKVNIRSLQLSWGQWGKIHGDEKAGNPCLSFSGLRILNSQITSSKLNQFLNWSSMFSEQICP